MIDLATRKAVGYAIADQQRAELVCDAISMAATRTALNELLLKATTTGVATTP